MNIRIGKGTPLALYAIIKPDGAVIAVRSKLAEKLQQALKKLDAAQLSDAVCDALEVEMTPFINSPDWFRGHRLFCTPSSFVDKSFGNIETITSSFPQAIDLHRKWKGEVFGQIVDGEVASWAAVKPLSDVAWDLRIDTLPEHRGKGYAKSVVSAAVKHIFDKGKLAGWGTDRTNLASLRTARSLGFKEYSLDLGCVCASEKID
jgi:RimJ/RimL family protein N-acetyltransferase